MSSHLTIRCATPADGDAIAAIYAHHVRQGTASFDIAAPDAPHWRAKIEDVLANDWPFLVAERGGQVRGYAYATQFRDRAAYAKTCENSIYIAPDAVGRGIGSRLLEALIARATGAGFCEMVAVVGGGEPASVALHRKFGFVEVGRLRNVGRKFGRLLDSVYLQLSLGKGSDHSNSTMI